MNTGRDDTSEYSAAVLLHGPASADADVEQRTASQPERAFQDAERSRTQRQKAPRPAHEPARQKAPRLARKLKEKLAAKASLSPGSGWAGAKWLPGQVDSDEYEGLLPVGPQRAIKPQDDDFVHRAGGAGADAEGIETLSSLEHLWSSSDAQVEGAEEMPPRASPRMRWAEEARGAPPGPVRNSSSLPPSGLARSLTWARSLLQGVRGARSSSVYRVM